MTHAEYLEEPAEAVDWLSAIHDLVIERQNKAQGG